MLFRYFSSFNPLFLWGFLCLFLRSSGPLSARVAWRPSPWSLARAPRPVSRWPSRFVVALASPAFGVALVAPLAHTPRVSLGFARSSSPSPVSSPCVGASLSPSRVACAPSPPWPCAWGWRFYESWLLWSLLLCPLSVLSPWSRPRVRRGWPLCPLARRAPFLPLPRVWWVGACAFHWRRSAVLLLRHLWLHRRRPRPIPLASWPPVCPGACR